MEERRNKKRQRKQDKTRKMPSKVTLAQGVATNSPTNGPQMNSSDQRSSGSYCNEGSDQGLKRKCV